MPRNNKNLANLKNKRNSLNAKLKLFSDFLTELETSKDKFDQLNARLQNFNNILNDFEDVQSEIECISDDEQGHLKVRIDFENTFYFLQSKANKMLQPTSISPSREITPLLDTAQVNANSNFEAQIKLPMINLPKFSGNLEQWLEFRDLYVSLIHSNQSIADIQKFHYLKASLEGDAARVIQSLALIENNYSLAWELLMQRFDNKSILIHNHIKSLFNLPTSNADSAVSLRKLHDDVTKHLSSLNSLGESTEKWDSIIIFMILERVDSQTLKEWETTTSNKNPTLEVLYTFLKERAELLEKLKLKNQTKPQPNPPRGIKPKYTTNSFSSTEITCVFCKRSHYISSCDKFQALSVHERSNEVRKLNLCSNCLRPGHLTKFCRSTLCRICHGKHHTLLHLPSNSKGPNTPVTRRNNENSDSSDSQTFSAHTTGIFSNVLLSTATVEVPDFQGRRLDCRVLLDSGSQSNFITSDFCKRLNIPTTETQITVKGIGKRASVLNRKCDIKILSKSQNFSLTATCHIIDDIAEIPKHCVDKSLISIPDDLKLADSDFNKPKPVDVLLGAGLFWSIIQDGRFQPKKHMPIIQNSKFGWIVSGPLQNVPFHSISPSNDSSYSFKITLQDQLSKFWEIEEITTPITSAEDNACETHFLANFNRDESGRCMVAIPFKESPSLLGNSQINALNQFKSLEKRMQTDRSFRKHYIDFMMEYKTLGHMSKVDSVKKPNFFLPHHGVLKQSSSTTKLRVVFNGSAPSSSGWSLNKLQMVGPNIQQDLCSILLRFRTHPYVATADIAKMYRQILIAPPDRQFQYIYWRDNPDDELSIFQLNTVTYGTASAAYLAVRSLKQLANIYHDQYLIANRIINDDFYVDDLLTGANSQSELIKAIQETNTVLQNGGLQLRKWRSNSPDLLHVLNKPETHDNHHFDDSDSSKTLGLLWSQSADSLMYEISQPSMNITKRSILSETAQIFDPLGLVTPCTINAKILIQKLWSLKIDWDEPVPASIQSEWQNFRRELLQLNELKIHRCVNPNAQHSLEIHGFCDASMNAYGACLYIKVSLNNKTHVSLMCAKTKVSPLKTLTIPRLELCGALILARLFDKVKSSLRLPISNYYLWCDSTIVLAWIKTAPSLLQTFPSNRVAQIQQLTNPENWRHVSSHENPADLLSRGMMSCQLINSDLWWSGPSFLAHDIDGHPVQPEILTTDIPELRKVTTTLLAKTREQQTESFTLFNNYSDFNKLVRTTSLILRFIHNCKSKLNRSIGSIQPKELNHATSILVKIAQRESFANEIELLKGESKGSLPNNINLLNPFIDNQGIIRVGGRLQHASNIQFDQKHPMLLPKDHKLVRLIVRHHHEKLFHAGPQATLSSIREQFWPIAAKNTTRQIIHKCIICYKIKPKTYSPLMGMLPTSRVSPTPPFYNCGVDYAGPFFIKNKNHKRASLFKTYICLFICMSTKAIHIELASDLSMEAFLACFRRFVSRRGRPNCVYSDNGKNFVAANKELKTLLNQLQGQLPPDLTNEGITWRFIPVNAPHFGGLWESGVKSVKYHIKRVMGNLAMTYEQFMTVLVQIEGILNSRPMTPLSSDPSDLQALSPAHFLIGRRLTSAADPDLHDISLNRLSKYQLIQQVQQHFWRRWQREYISNLQTRQKWRTQGYDLQLGTLVLIQDDNLPPSHWHLGRIIKLYPGSDNITRVADVKTHNGVVRRAFSKLCPLPQADDLEESSPPTQNQS